MQARAAGCCSDHAWTPPARRRFNASREYAWRKPGDSSPTLTLTSPRSPITWAIPAFMNSLVIFPLTMAARRDPIWASGPIFSDGQDCLSRLACSGGLGVTGDSVRRRISASSSAEANSRAPATRQAHGQRRPNHGSPTGPARRAVPPQGRISPRKSSRHTLRPY